MQKDKLIKTSCIGLSAILIFFAYNIFLPVKISNPEIVIIPGNVTGNEVINILKSRRLIKNSFSAKIYLKITNWGYYLQAGEYEFTPPISPAQILKKIHLGQIHDYPVTIPEGWTIKDMAQFLGDKGLADTERFLRLAKDKEGYLYPDTYHFYKGIKEEEIIELMEKRFHEIVPHFFETASVLQLKEAVILASIVEKEAGMDNERNIIASVFLNRLKKRMKLESCATVVYAMGRHKENLDYNDLKIKSLYNTYLHYGLPPGPISNPGINSIMAVLTPVETDFLYFVSRHDGTHEFSKTLKNHLLAKKKYPEKI